MTKKRHSGDCKRMVIEINFVPGRELYEIICVHPHLENPTVVVPREKVEEIVKTYCNCPESESRLLSIKTNDETREQLGEIYNGVSKLATFTS